MAKNTKKSAVNHGKPITSFFARTSKPSSQDKPHSSAEPTSTILSLTVDESTSNPNVSEVIFAEVSKTPTKNVAPLRASSLRQKKNQAPVTPSSNTSLKRPRSPNPHSPSKTSSSRLLEKYSPVQRRTKVGSHPDTEIIMTSKVVGGNSITNFQARKKARLSSSDEESRDVIPSSQSDEEELTLKGSNNPVTPVMGSQERSIPLAPEGGDQGDNMLVDSEWGPQTTKGTISAADILLAGRTSNKSATSAEMLTPPSSDLPSIPPTPRQIDAQQKIAQLRAEIYAETRLSPESSPVYFNEKLDSSSDEEEVPRALTQLKSNTGQNYDSSVNQPPAPRYSLRNRLLPSPSDGSRHKTFTRQSAQNKNTSPTRDSTKNKGQKAKANPFATLLREKKAADKHGVGDDAFRLAEMTALRLKNKDPLDDMDLDEEDDVDWDAATRSARDMQTLFQETASKSGTNNDSSLKGIDEEERKTFLGTIKGKGNGKGLVDILEQDQVGEREAILLEKKSGIRLWSFLNGHEEPADVAKGVSDSTRIYQIPGDNEIVRLCNVSLQRNDISQARLLFDMDIMCLVSPSERSTVASSICELALSPQSHVLSDSATHALEKFWNSSGEPMNSTISFSQIKKVMLSLGAEASILATQKWSVPSSGQPNRAGLQQRGTIITRLIRLTESCARSQRLAKSDIPNITVALLLLGMDSETSYYLLEDVTRVVDLACNCIPKEDAELAHTLCVKILRCAGSYEPINKARLISLLASGGGVTRVVATAVAHCFITDKQHPKKESVFGLSPLFPIIDQLIPDPDTPGKFSLFEHTNYDDIGRYIFILGVAISNIKEYVAEERSPQSRVMRAEASTKFGERAQTDLQVIRSALEGLHNKISDTRAAHLERSRAKAAIKVLSMAIHYQREHCIRNDPENQTKTLDNYFTKKDK